MKTQTKAEILAALFGKSAKPIHPVLAAREGKKS
jgi:hypothetical protein